MDLKNFIADYWPEITLVLGNIATFFAGRKTKSNNEKSGELDNIEKIRSIEKQLLLDMEEQILKLIDNNNKLETIVERQSNKIRAYEMKYGSL